MFSARRGNLSQQSSCLLGDSNTTFTHIIGIPVVIEIGRSVGEVKETPGFYSSVCEVGVSVRINVCPVE